MKPEFPTLKTLILTAAIVTACTAPPASPTVEVTQTTPPPTTTAPSPTTPPGQIRPPTVAGSWYPNDPEQLTEMVEAMLKADGPVDGAPIGLIVPHAGYVFSGPVAAAGFRQLEEGEYEVAVVIASDHQSPLSDPISVWAEGGFETPLGAVPVDVELAQALVEAEPRIAFDPTTHEGEHPIEIELPFLQRVCPHCAIVPILMGSDDEATVRMLADALLDVLPTQGAVVIASSDLSHYPSREDAARVDGATLGAIETGEPERVRAAIDTSMEEGIPSLATCACGRGPILVTMHVAAGLGADTVTLLRYANSADSPYGSADRVVGYGAVMFWHYDPPDLTEAHQEELLNLARTTLESYLEEHVIPPYETDEPPLTRRSGAFVTLRENGDLRGCIGHTRADQPLHRVVQETAVQAATEDPRFPALTGEELADITIEISVLSPFRRVTDVEEIEVGTHGLMTFQGTHQGLLLPQVPVEQGWNREELLEGLCEKARLAQGCWRQGATLYAFTAIVFGEE
jgi:AmmeMemoRadiSam system protein B/AmmeMemoRadiSam system protein A